MVDETWTTQIEKYLGENPEQYFSCPARPSLKGETTYALVQYEREPGTVSPDGDTVAGSPDTLLLVEVSVPVPLGEAVVTVDEVLELAKLLPGNRGRCRNPPHDYIDIFADRSGAVRTLYVDRAKELYRALGREQSEP